MTFTILDLPWLPEPPADFKERCKALSSSQSGLGQALATLAAYRLSSTQSLTFSRTMRRLREAGGQFAPLSPFRLAILPAFTFDTIADMIPSAGARHGVAIDIAIAEFDQIVQTAANPGAEVFQPRPDAVLMMFDHRWLGLDRFVDDASNAIKSAIDRVAVCLSHLREGAAVQTIVSTVAIPPGGLFGNLDRRLAGSVRSQLEGFNRALVAVAAESGAAILDVAAIAEQVGTAHWFDPVAWGLFKIPFSTSCSGLFADTLGRLIGSMRGTARKCLVLDCDNTIWGGVIGDDGLENIIVGPGSAEGESFASVQRLALELKARGVFLAVCSKNDDEVARLPFVSHPDMLLRESDIAVFQANWIDKPTNLEAIARTLEIGLDALVLLDDNSAERAQVRAALPMVAVPELPADPAYFSLYLSSAGYFESISFSEEDRRRGDSHESNARRAAIQEHSRDLGEYLQELQMEIGLHPFDTLGRQRIVQLINKTNQFNLTTRRYTDAEITALIDRKDVFTLQVRLKDRFSDFGMIGVCIVHQRVCDDTSWDIDTWLMSCRVLGRRVEEAMLRALVEAAARAGKKQVFARYLRTAKNTMVADLFDRLGFECLFEGDDGSRHYRLNIASYAFEELPHSVRRD